MTIGEIIRNRRKELNMTQEDLIRKSGVSRPTISTIESGVHDGNIRTIMRIFNALGLELSVRRKK